VTSEHRILWSENEGKKGMEVEENNKGTGEYNNKNERAMESMIIKIRKEEQIINTEKEAIRFLLVTYV
jgi:hypothetical protein